MRERNRLVEAEIASLRRYALSLTADAEDARDLVQDCVERALKGWSSWRGEGSVRAWLFSIMHNVFVSGKQKRARWRLVMSDADVAGLPIAGPPAIDALYLRDLKKSLEEMSDDQRQVLFLVAVEGFSYAEASVALAIPVGTIMSRLARAREHLRTQLDEGPSKEKCNVQ